MGGVRIAIGIIFTLLTVFWLNRPEKFDWKPHGDDIAFQECPETAKEVHFLFGGTSMLGRYIVDTWKREFKDVCLVNYNRKECKYCDVSYTGDVRDTKYISALLRHHSSSKQTLTTVLYSIKPHLEFTAYKTFIEVNYNALVEVTKVVKALGVPNLIYTSSIACSNHYTPCHNCTEQTTQPLLTEYEAPYDLSKRLAEDYILSQADKNFNTVALRVSGILGGEGDPFFHHRAFPFIFTFSSPVIVDYNFAANIADALAEISKTINSKQAEKISGKFFYYTGEHIEERSVAVRLAEIVGKPLLEFPSWTLAPVIEFWQWFRWSHSYYTIMDLMRMANIEQTFDQTLFFNTFPAFKPKYTVLQSLQVMYAKDQGKQEL